MFHNVLIANQPNNQRNDHSPYTKEVMQAFGKVNANKTHIQPTNST